MTQVKNKVEELTEDSTSTLPSKIENNLEQMISWVGLHIAFMQKHNQGFENSFKKLILLYSDSNTRVLCEKDYITKIWESNEKKGVRTNGRGQLI